MTGEGKLVPLRRVQGAVEEMTDRALVSAVAERDQAALGALYDRFHRDVYRFAGRLAHHDDLDDLVQLVFLEAHRSAPRFRGDSAVKTWLFGIAVNLVRNHHRGEHRRKRALEVLGAQPSAAPPHAREAIGLEQQRRMVATAVETLSPALREAYVICVIEEMPGKEAATALGIREASLWRRLSDARDALRTAIEEMQR
jgi:RNA polymerase sigma-70 factor (ECF subfamily)